MYKLKENMRYFVLSVFVTFVVIIFLMTMNSCSPKNPLHSTAVTVSGDDNNGSGGGGSGGGTSPSGSGGHSTVITFDAGNDSNNEWGGSQGLFSDKDEDAGSTTTVSIGYSSSDDATGNGKYAIYMDYNVNSTTNGLGYRYAGFYVASPAPYNDMRGYKYIIFKIKGSTGNENIKAVLRDGSGVRLEAYTYTYVPSGAITTSYQWCKVPIANMSASGSFSTNNVTSIQFKCVIVGENSRVYIDNIYVSSNTNTL